jgi:hypothetical protein
LDTLESLVQRLLDLLSAFVIAGATQLDDLADIPLNLLGERASGGPRRAFRGGHLGDVHGRSIDRAGRSREHNGGQASRRRNHQ